MTMSGFKLGGMTLGSVFKKPETVQYPFEQKVSPAGLRGHVDLHPESCILCGICQKACPCDAILVDKKARTWAIKRFSCVQCGACVRSCPKQCLSMEASYTQPAASKSQTVIEVPDQKAPAASSEEA